MIMCLSSVNTERCPSDVTVLSTHPPTAGWHSVVLFMEGYSPLKPVSKAKVAPSHSSPQTGPCATDAAFTKEQSYGTRAQERRPQGHSGCDFTEHKTSRVWLEWKQQWGGWTCLTDRMEKLCLLPQPEPCVLPCKMTQTLLGNLCRLG